MTQGRPSITGSLRAQRPTAKLNRFVITRTASPMRVQITMNMVASARNVG